MRQVLAFLVLVIVGSASVPGLGPSTLPSDVLRIRLDPEWVLASARTGNVELVLPTGPMRFELAPRALAEGAAISVDGTAAGVASEVRTFTGTAMGYPAVLAATRVGVFALIAAPDPLFIQPAWVSARGTHGSDHMVGRGSGLPIQSAAHADPLPGGPSGPNPEPTGLPPPPTDRVAKILVEGDAAFYQRSNPDGNCPDCWIDLQRALVLVTEALYRPQTGIRFEISSQWVCKSAADCPYIATGGIADPAQYLNAFRAKWETRADEPSHHVAHLFSGTNFAGGTTGLAFGASVSTPWGYSTSEFGVVTADLSLASYATAAHEIGHNFDGRHDQALPWTIMWQGTPARATFTDGTLLESKNNAARIISHAIQQLPP